MKRNSGFTLLELLLVIGLSTAVTISAFQDKMLEEEQASARQLGMELFHYNSAVQNYLARESGGSNPGSLNGVTKQGVKWLQSSTLCSGGQAANEWLSCEFMAAKGGKTSFGSLTLTTTMSYSTSSGLDAVTVVSPLELSRSGTLTRRGDLSGLAALVASGAYSVSDGPSPASAQDSAVIYCPEIASYTGVMATVCNGRKGSIVMFSRNSSEGDRWLRIDHGNVMQNTLEFRTGSITPATPADMSAIDSTNRQIRNVARIYNLGVGNSNAENDNLYLGKKNVGLPAASKILPTLTSDSVIVDADQEVLGKLIVATSIETTDGNIYAKDKTGGANATNAGNIQADHNITANGDLIAKTNAKVTGTVDIGGSTAIHNNLRVDGQMYSGSLATDYSASIGGNLTTYGTTRLQGGVVGDTVFNNKVNIKDVLSITRIVDSNNTAYYLDPASTSNLNAITANSVTASGTVRGSTITSTGAVNGATVKATGASSAAYFMPGVFTLGAGCTPNGAQARDNTGKGMSCVGGVWKSGGGITIGAWRSYTAGVTHIAPDNGFIIVKSSHNGWIKIFVSGVERCYVASRDKYGQGEENCSTVVAKGESFMISDRNNNPSYIYFRPFS